MPTLPVPSRVRAPGWRSDLGLHAALGSLEELDLGWRCELPRAPDNPFANVLVLRGSPASHAPASLAPLFERFFGDTTVEHVSVGWDDPDADPRTLAPFEAAGFDAADDVVLAFDGTELGASGEGALGGIRRLDFAQDGGALLACELAVDGARAMPYGPAAIRRNLAWCADLVQQEGIGAWYGAELDGTIVASLGIVSVGGEGRLQSVGTRPRHRSQGIGRALLAWAWQDAADRLGLDRVVLITRRGGGAERFYQRLGFRRIGANLGVARGRAGPVQSTTS